MQSIFWRIVILLEFSEMRRELCTSVRNIQFIFSCFFFVCPKQIVINSCSCFTATWGRLSKGGFHNGLISSWLFYEVPLPSLLVLFWGESARFSVFTHLWLLLRPITRRTYPVSLCPHSFLNPLFFWGGGSPTSPHGSTIGIPCSRTICATKKQFPEKHNSSANVEIKGNWIIGIWTIARLLQFRKFLNPEQALRSQPAA